MALSLTFCKREKDSTPPPGYPTSGLVVKNQLNLAVVNSFSATGPAAPLLAANREAYALDYPAKFIYFALPTGSEAVANASASLLADSVWETASGPDFYLNTEFLSDDLLPGLKFLDETLPIIGASHAVRERDTAYQVDVKVEFFEDFQGRTVYICTFAALDFLAKDYGGGVNLKLQNVPNFINSSGDVSLWDTDVPLALVRPETEDTTTLLFKKGEPFMHKHIVASHDPRYGVPGIVLDTINRFGNEFFKWDVFGSQFTPLRFFVPKNTLTDIAEKIHFVTLVFTDASGDDEGYILLNSHFSTFK